jgi:hypothetical protein
MDIVMYYNYASERSCGNRNRLAAELTRASLLHRRLWLIGDASVAVAM